MACCLAEWLPLSAVCRPRDGSSTCADDSLTLDRLWHCTIPPTVHLSPTSRSGLIHDKTTMLFWRACVSICGFLGLFFFFWVEQKMPQGKLITSASVRFSATDLGGVVENISHLPTPPDRATAFVEPLFALSRPGSDLFALRNGESDKGMEGWREMERRGGSSFV